MQTPSNPLNDALEAHGQDDYEQLPEAIKHTITRKEFLWLSEGEKARLIQSECEPEW